MSMNHFRQPQRLINRQPWNIVLPDRMKTPDETFSSVASIVPTTFRVMRNTSEKDDENREISGSILVSTFRLSPEVWSHLRCRASPYLMRFGRCADSKERSEGDGERNQDADAWANVVLDY